MHGWNENVFRGITEPTHQETNIVQKGAIEFLQDSWFQDHVLPKMMAEGFVTINRIIPVEIRNMLTMNFAYAGAQDFKIIDEGHNAVKVVENASFIIKTETMKYKNALSDLKLRCPNPQYAHLNQYLRKSVPTRKNFPILMTIGCLNRGIWGIFGKNGVFWHF